MGKDVLTDSLLADFSKAFDVSQYPPSEFSTNLFSYAAVGNNAQYTANLGENPKQAYRILLGEFVQQNGRGMESAKKLIDILDKNGKKLLADTLEKEIEKASKKTEGSRQQTTLPHGENKKFVWISVLVILIGVVAAVVVPWLGTLTKSDINECASSPCQNGGTCVDEVNGFRCICASGFHGVDCQEDINECASSPCQNGGTCVDKVNEFKCTCAKWFRGVNCQEEYIAETFTVQECQQLLQEYYDDDLFKIPITPWDSREFVNLSYYFTTVSLCKEDKPNADEPWQKITLNGSISDIFQTEIRGALPKRIVLFGEAGRGKTTAVAKMAFDWANKTEDSPLKDVKLLFVFKMRNMDEQIGIAEAVVTLLGKKFKKYVKQLEEYIDSHEKDIVILFDGYDEFRGDLHGSSNTGDIIDILNKNRCKHCRVLVTSRPTRKDDFGKIYSKMVIEGYSQQQARNFIDKFFSNMTKGIELQKYLKEDIVTRKMIATPLFCTMVCYLWNEGWIHGNFTRTKLLDEMMEYLRTHLNDKIDKRDEKIDRGLLNDIVISIGKVAYEKLTNKEEFYPVLLRKEDFSAIDNNKVNISLSLGLLTRSNKADRDVNIHIEFFHKLAQEYSAGRYLASNLDKGRFSTIDLSEIASDMKEVLQFASGTSDSACQKIVASIVDRVSNYKIADREYNNTLILDLLSETKTCGEQSKTHLTQLLKDGKLHLREVTASTVVGFERLPGSVKEKITNIDIRRDKRPGFLFSRSNRVSKCTSLMEMYQHVPPTISSDMNQLDSVNSFTTASQPSADDSDFGDDSAFTFTSEVFRRLWNHLNSTQSLSRLALPIPANITSNLKQLRSIRVFKSNSVTSLRSFAHVLTFLPQIKELIFSDVELPEMTLNLAAFCELWENLHISPQLNRLFLPLPEYLECHLRPLLSVQVFETKSSSIVIPFILRSLPNLHKLILHSDLIPKSGFECDEWFFEAIWKIIHNYHELQHLKVKIPNSVPVLPMEPLRSVKIFQTRMDSQMMVFPRLLSLLPNILELDIFARYVHDGKITENVYFDRVLSVIVDELVENNIRLEVLNITFRRSSNNASNTVSHDTVNNFVRMLKSSGRVKQLKIDCYEYCVFNESDLIEIIGAIRALTSVVLLSLDCRISSEGELFQYAMQSNQSTEQKPKLDVESRQRRPLNLTLFYRDQKEKWQERNFVLPPLD